MKSHPRLDSNHNEVRQALEAVGAKVYSTAALGDGFPDLIAGYKGINILFEVKDGKKPPSKRKLTPDELKWHNSWKGQVNIVETPESAILKLLELTKN